ncbi:MAG: MOSC domain-containing protein [Candidatus Omnitrophica bacterium]|nr:MOSC domain-containing protein [Candidatus Omnitrophota bacterium]
MVSSSKRYKGAKIHAISLSAVKGTIKSNVQKANVIADFGIEGDSHAGPGKRQISLLPKEAIDDLGKKGFDVRPGNFAENLTTSALDTETLSIGRKLRVGGEVILQITQRGKRCHGKCGIYDKIGKCIMPRKGIFARVLKGGGIKVQDRITLIED